MKRVYLFEYQALLFSTLTPSPRGLVGKILSLMLGLPSANIPVDPGFLKGVAVTKAHQYSFSYPDPTYYPENRRLWENLKFQIN
jgi:hypothetical protein